MNIRLLAITVLLILIVGCSDDDGGTTGGSGNIQPLSAASLIGDWNVVEFYKNGETYSKYHKEL